MCAFVCVCVCMYMHLCVFMYVRVCVLHYIMNTYQHNNYIPAFLTA